MKSLGVEITNKVLAIQGSETPGVAQETRVEAMNVIGELSVLGTKILLEIPGFATESHAEISKMA